MQADRGTRANRKTRALAAALLSATGAAALTLTLPAAAVAQQLSFSKIVVEGNQRIDASTVLSYAGLTTGTPYSPGAVNAAYQRIVGSGLFESVDITPSGSTLTIKVKEYPTINEISIEGNRRLSDDTLKKLVTSQSRRVYSPAQAEADARAIAQAYQQAGRLAAQVTPKIIPRSQNRVDLVFEVTEGAVVEVERIAFVGNLHYSDRRLRQVLGTKQAGLFHQIIQSDSYVQDRIAYDKQMLTDFYRSRGYVDFQILSVTSEFSQERNGFFLTFNVREGLPYKFAHVSVASEVPEINAADYQNDLRTRAGQDYSPTRVDDGVSRLERAVLHTGLDFIQVEPRIKRNDADQTLDLTYVFTRAPRRFVERIDIEGNTTTRDSVIRRQFDTVEGDPFNPTAIREAADRIRKLGYFSKSDVTTHEGSAPDRVIVDVNVTDQPTGTLSFGVNYSVSDGFGGVFQLSERNFMGRGQTLSFSVSAGVDNTSSSIQLIDPSMLGRDVSGSMQLFYDKTDQYNSYYDTRELGISPSIGFPINDTTRLTFRYRLAEEKLRNVDEDSSEILMREEGTYLNSAPGYTLSYDSSKIGLDPNTSYQLTFGQDFAGLGGDAHYIKTTASAVAQTKVAHEEIGLKATLEGGNLSMTSGDSTVLDRFTAGSRIRGFERNGIGPRDLTAGNKDALGGMNYVALRLESNFPIGLPAEYGITGGLFFDTGSIWGLDDKSGNSGSVDDSFHLRAVIGASIFWTTPIGPLRFDFTKAVKKESYDKEQNFNFTVSTTF